MQKKEAKNKVGRPKLADSKTKKASLIIIGVAIVSILALFLGCVFAMTNTNLTSLKGAINISDCEIYVNNIKDTEAKLKWSCSKGKVKAYSVFIATEEGKLGLILPFSTRITSKQTSSVLIKKLSPGTEYIVRAITSDNQFISSNPFTTTGESKLKIVGKSITSNSMTIGWDSRSLKSSAKKITLLKPVVGGEAEEIGSKIAFTKQGAVTFKKLEPETEYEACVQLRNDEIKCESFTTKDKYNVTSQALLNSVTVSWGTTNGAKLKRIEIYAADENYELIDLVDAKDFAKPKKVGIYTAKKLTHGVHYVVKAIFDNGKEIIKNKKVLSSHKFFVVSSDKDLIISWADSKAKVAYVQVTLLDDAEEDLEVVFEEPYEEPKASGVIRVPDLEQDKYYRILVRYDDNKEVSKIFKTLYAYNVLVVPTSKTATVSWSNTSVGVKSIELEKINEENEMRDDNETIDSETYTTPKKIGLKTFKGLEEKTAYSITVTYEDETKVTEEFRTFPEIKIEEDSDLYKILGFLSKVLIK